MNDGTEDRRDSGGRAPYQTRKRRGVSNERENDVNLDDLIEEIRWVYDKPPYDISKRAYLELCLVVTEKLDGETEGPLNSNALYTSLSEHARSEVDPSKGGIGITNLADAPATLTTERRKYKNTLYTVGHIAADAHEAYQSLATESPAEVAKAVSLLDKTGEIGNLEQLQPRNNYEGGDEEGRGRDNCDPDEERTESGDYDSTKRSHNSGGALGYGKSPNEDDEDPCSNATDVDSAGSEPVWKSHFSGSLREKVPEPKPVLDELENALSGADVGGYRPVLQHGIAHVYYCQTRMPSRYGDGVPISFELWKNLSRGASGVKVPTRTADIWEPVKGELLEVSNYIYREEGEGKAREFRLHSDFLRRLDEALEDSYDRKTRYNLVNGKRLYSGFKTELTYDGEHSWAQRSQFIYKTLKGLKGQRDLANKAAVEDHLDRLKKKRDAAQERCERLEAELEELKDKILEEDKSLSEEEKERLSEAREPVYEAARELDRVESRYRQDLRIWSDIISQGLEEAEDQPEGIYQYETAWEVQEASGRFTMLCGLQNASEEMKAAAAKGIPNYRNKDIKSSQTEAIIQEMEMAVRMGADLDLSAIKDYLEAGGKDALADRYNIDRDLWKRPEHSVKFGAGFNHDTYKAALGAAKGKILDRITDDDDDDDDDEPDFRQLHQFKYESGEVAWERAVYNELPTMAAVARDWADNDEIQYDDPEELYSILQEAYGDMAAELDAWRDWLVDEYWTEAGQHGSRFGYFVSNPCSLPFSIHDPRLADSDDEEPSRYNQKAGFATSRLQGLESANMHALALIQDDFDYELLRNEHDGVVVLGEIPEEALEMARLISGFHRAELEEKPFEPHESQTEDQSCNTTKSKDRSAQNQPEKPSKSRTSPSEENSGGGSAGGTADPDGARSERTPSGSPPTSPGRFETTSATTSKASGASDSSTENPDTNDSRTSSGGITGTTLPDDQQSFDSDKY